MPLPARLYPGRAAALALYLLAVLVFATAVGWYALRDGMARLSERADADLSLAADQLTGQLERFRELAVLLTDHPVLAPLAETGTGDAVAADALLLKEADRTGSEEILLLDRNGTVIASSRGSDVGRTDDAQQGYFQSAMHGTLGFSHAVEGDGATRVFIYAAPVFSATGPVAGAVVVRLAADRIEAPSRGDAQSVFFSDAGGVVFVTNRSELLFGARTSLADPGPGLGYPDGLIHAFPALTAWHVFGRDLWSIDGGPYLPWLALHLTKPLPVVAMRGEILVDALPTLQVAGLQAAVAAALCLIFGAILLVVGERRRALALRLATEARLTAQLERRVGERTQELSDAVHRLQREVGERMEAEAALKTAQAELLRAGKLSALGQMSAGISHELNQPLMAIRSYAENGAAFLARGRPETAAQNLTRIGDLAERMGRIIRNLRAFARQEVEGIANVDLCAVVAAALEMTEPRLRQEDVTLDFAAPAAPVWVRGGEVRLQQVVLNILANALDAMAGQDDRHLSLRILPGDPVRLTCRDSGPGIAEPDRVFDPFYTTKEVGQAEGMGLGLAISDRIIQSFGGRILARNPDGGGAEFTVELIAAAPSEAAA
ncbi:MAG: sensor histidine kinase [Rhodobacteraceae bacterium]|nr:sensor histidine kinase [Paracoccaceae bacterium]